MNHTDDEDNSMDVDEIQVRLKTSDGKRFTLSKSEALCSNALRMIVQCNRNGSSQTDYIQLQYVNSKMLTKVLEWCHRHPAVQDGCSGGHESDSITWDKNFFKQMTHEDLLRLTHVANYLDIRSLFDACCQSVAKQWEGLKVDEIRKLYAIECDFTAEEDHQMFMESKKLGMDN